MREKGDAGCTPTEPRRSASKPPATSAVRKQAGREAHGICCVHTHGQFHGPHLSVALSQVAIGRNRSLDMLDALLSFSVTPVHCMRDMLDG